MRTSSVKEIRYKGTNPTWFHLKENSRASKSTETESGLVVVRGCRRGSGYCLLIGMGLPFMVMRMF